MGQTEALLPSAFTSAAPSIAAFALDEVKLCCSFSDDLELLRQNKIFLEDQVKYVEKRYLEHQLRISENNRRGQNDLCASVVEVIRIMKSASYDIEDIINESYHLEEQFGDSSCLQKVLSFFSLSNPIVLKADLIQRMKYVRNELRRLQHLSPCAETLPTSVSQTTSYVNTSSTIIGRDYDLRRIKDILKQPNSEITIVPIFGPVGFGKTSIAHLIYYDPWIEKAFNLRIWINLSIGTVDIEGIGQQIISKAGKVIEGNMELKNTLQHLLNCQRCLIVLDGLWGEDEKVIELKQMLMTGQETRSKIIVTTHSEKVANLIATVQAYRLPALSEEHCCAIFKSAIICQNLNWFEQYGEDIISRCEGIPLIAKFLGSVVNTRQRWEQTWKTAKVKEMWMLEKDTINAMPMFQSFKQIYCNMSANLRKCFVYCSVFPNGSYLDKEKLTRQWVALGLIELRHNTFPAEVVADLYIEEIKTIFFFEVADKLAVIAPESSSAPREVLRMHTLAYNFARSVGCNDILVFSEDDKIDKAIKYCDYRYGRICTSALKSIDRKKWPLKARALVLKASEIELKLVTKVISANKYLRVIDLRGCTIKKLPSCVFRLKHLRYLDASGLPISKIPLQRNCFQKLETLDLSETKLEELPSCISNLKMLSYLSLRGCCELLHLPSSFAMCGNLQYLDLSQRVGLRELPESFVKLRNIPFLDLSGCQDSITQFDSLSNNLEASAGKSVGQNRIENSLIPQSSNSSKPTRHSDSLSSEISESIPKDPSIGVPTRGTNVSDAQSALKLKYVCKPKACEQGTAKRHDHLVPKPISSPPVFSSSAPSMLLSSYSSTFESAPSNRGTGAMSSKEQKNQTGVARSAEQKNLHIWSNQQASSKGQTVSANDGCPVTLHKSSACASSSSSSSDTLKADSALPSNGGVTGLPPKDQGQQRKTLQ